MTVVEGEAKSKRYGAPLIVTAAAGKADARRLFNEADWQRDFVFIVYRNSGTLKAQKTIAGVSEAAEGWEAVERWVDRLADDWALPAPVEHLIGEWRRKGMRSPLTVRISPAILARR
jgi:hypothetical protein